MKASSQIGIAQRTRFWWSGFALLSIIFHVGLASLHCHDLEGFQGKIGLGIEHFQDGQNTQAPDDDENSCVICQLLSVFKGTSPQTLALSAAAFAGLIIQLFVWKTAFVPLYLCHAGRPRAPPLS